MRSGIGVFVRARKGIREPTNHRKSLGRVHMKTTGLLQVTGGIARKNREMASGVVKSLTVAMIAMLCLGAANTARAVTWTAGEIVQAIQQAQASGQPFDRLLAQKVQEELARANFQIVDNQLVYSTTTPGTYTNLAQNCPNEKLK